MQGIDGRFVQEPVEDRFWPKVAVGNDPDDCWIWLASTNPEGYGVFWTGKRQIGAHRFAYEWLVGRIPEGLELDHLCRLTLCVNPRHLDPVTSQINVHRSDGPMGINSRLERCRRGHEFAGIWRDRRTCRICTRDRQRAHRARRVA
jgi:hypothetical protein